METEYDRASGRAPGAARVEASVAEIILVHLVTRVAGQADQPREWLRGFADEVHASIDRAPWPADPQARRMAEALRDRLDRLMHGVGVRLSA